MKTKQCPYCHKELSSEAVLCKYCHNLLIDDEGNMSGDDSADDRTKVFTKQQLEEFEDKTRPFKKPEGAVLNEDNSANVYSGASADEVFPENGKLYNEYEGDEEYDDSDDDDESRKRLFVITAVITVCLLIVIIAAIVVGMKLFGKKDNSDSSSSKSGPPVVSAATTTTPAAETPVDTGDNGEGEQSGEPAATDNGEVTPAVTDDTAVQTGESGSESQSETGESGESGESTETVTTAPVENPDDSTAETTTTASSEEGDDTTETTTTASSEEGDGSYDSIVLNAASSYISGEVTGSQFRTDDGVNVYYYFFTDDGAHGYSVAYNKNTGAVVVDQNY